MIWKHKNIFYFIRYKRERLTTPYNKKTEKRQRNDSCTEDLENSETPKKVKARKELLEETEPSVEISGNISPRKKLSDIVNHSGVVRELPKRRFVDFSTEDTKASSSNVIDDQELKPEKEISILQNALTSQEVSKPEPVKKRWLREACQDSSKWEDDFGQPINWEDEPIELKREETPLEKPTQLKIVRVEPFIVHSSCENPPVLNTQGSLYHVEEASSLKSNLKIQKPEDFYFQESFYKPENYFGNNFNLRTDNLSGEGYKLNETRPTVLMHSSKCNYEDSEFVYQPKKQRLSMLGNANAENNYHMPYYQPYSMIDREVDKLSDVKVNDDPDFSTALALMELKRSANNNHF